MNQPYTGVERRKASLIEQLGKRVTMLELNTDRQNAEILRLEKEVTKVKDICRSCIGFGDDFK